MSTMNARTATIGEERGLAGALVSAPGERLARSPGSGLRLASSLAAVGGAGITYWIADGENPWIAANLLAALAAGSAFLLLAFGLLRGGKRESLVAIAGCCAVFGFSQAASTGPELWLAAAFATHAIAGAILETWAAPSEHELLSWLGPWSSFHAVMAVLLWS
jgi:hypothetical protein